MYPLLRRLLFFLPPETAHYFSMNVFRFLCSFSFVRKFLSGIFQARNSEPLEVFGLSFRNIVGMGAGFDKNAKYLRELEVMGFGFAEIGTVTPRPQCGNPKPRLFRLPKDKALINRMGFNNDGADVVASRLKKYREDLAKLPAPRFLIGGNIGKNKDTPNEQAHEDYAICFEALHPYVDFFVVNVSSPNTPGLRALQEKDSLKKILETLQALNAHKATRRAILLKIAPDLTEEQLNDVVDLVQEIRLDGVVATNTTISRSALQTSSSVIQTIGAGGLSGRPVTARSTEVIRYIHQRSGGSFPIIGSGGIFTGTQAKEKMNAGATLLEVWTGFIYEGPFIVKKILRAL